MIITEWEDDQDMARSRVFRHLQDGQDIPHYLEITKTNGSTQFGICYRFYEDPDKAESALTNILPDFPAAELLMVSVRGEKLYLMESGMK